MSLPTKHPDERRRNEIRGENAIRVVRPKDPAPENGALDLVLGLVWVSCPRDCEGITLLVQEELRKTGAHVHVGKEPPREEVPSSVLLCPEGEGIAPTMRRVRALAPHAPVVVCGPTPEPQMAAEALQTGASGFVHVGLPPEQIALALSLVLDPRLPFGTASLHAAAQALRLLGCASFDELAPLEVGERC